MKQTVLIAVGACAIDTILTVPHYPEADSKLRAISLKKRRGGNCPNTLEVLQQLIYEDRAPSSARNEELLNERIVDVKGLPSLKLVATLPSRSSPHVPFIVSSYDYSWPIDKHTGANSTPLSLQENGGLIDFSHCIYRESHTEPVSSYIIADQSTGSRTIINYNDLQEMSFEEFKQVADSILKPSGTPDANEEHVQQYWFHFEGRIPPTTVQCVQYLRNHGIFRQREHNCELRISVELEKPGREGLQELAFEANVVFYSKSWAEGEGYKSPSECLTKQADILRPHDDCHDPSGRTLICTWAEEGSTALRLCQSDEQSIENVIKSPAFVVPGSQILDTVGAGDTFIAGMLFALMCRDNKDSHAKWSLKQMLCFANELAGRKILQYGFGALAGQVLPLRQLLDETVD